MMVSTAAFPDSSKIPAPAAGLPPIQLERVGRRRVAVVQFNTTKFPGQADFDAACGQLAAGPLPRGYVLNMTSSWSPTVVLYSGLLSKLFNNECWMEVA